MSFFDPLTRNVVEMDGLAGSGNKDKLLRKYRNEGIWTFIVHLGGPDRKWEKLTLLFFFLFLPKQAR